MLKDTCYIKVSGHAKIVDDLGNVLLDKDNAVHPQNLARVFSRALAFEDNFTINRMAFGNGGTTTNAAYVTSYNPPNDGQPPDPNTWNSRIYHEIYSEIVKVTTIPGGGGAGINNLNPLLGSDPGSADANTGVRPGGGAVPSNDPPTIPFVSVPGVTSVESGLISNTIITCVLNASEPTGTYLDSVVGASQAPNGTFVFDEIGLYTTGAAAIATNGYQQVYINNQTATGISNLQAGKFYSFQITIDGGNIPQTVRLQVPATGGSGANGAVLFGDLVVALMTGNPAWNIVVNGSAINNVPFLSTKGAVTITNDGTFSSYLPAAQTYGYLNFQSNSTGASSSVALSAIPTAAGQTPDGVTVPYYLFDTVNGVAAGANVQPAVQGVNAGVQNAPTAPSTEAERLLAHLIFSPIQKAPGRTLTITYTLAVSVARTPSS